MIYFIQAQHLVKIGYARNVQKRKAVLQSTNPIELILLGEMEGDKRYEHRLHKFFEEFRHRGEWFHLTDEIKDFIKKNCIIYKKTTRAKALSTNKSIGRKKHFTLEQIAAISFLLKNSNEVIDKRNHALFMIAFDSMLRASDILNIRINDIQYKGTIKKDLFISQQKTKETVKCSISDETQDALLKYLNTYYGNNWPVIEKVFRISDKQYRNIVKGWALMLNLNPTEYSTHSMRRTKAVEIYKRTKDLESIRILLGQKSLASTSAYLGIDAFNAYEVANSIGIDHNLDLKGLKAFKEAKLQKEVEEMVRSVKIGE